MASSCEALGRAPATLIIGFNRPAPFRKVLLATLAANPARLYIAVDGPRPAVPADVDRVAAVRSIAQSAVAQNDVELRLREDNLGCRRGPIDAIDWFLEDEPEGIILEDDCLPSGDFFRFAAEMLDRYRNDPKVMSISGHGVLRSLGRSPDTYTFVRTPLTWGWATWRHAWSRFDRDGSQWEAVMGGDWVMEQGNCFRDFERHWRAAFNNAKTIDTWDYSWTFSSWVNEGLSVIPYGNLVANIGFDEDATHTATTGEEWYGALDTMKFPLRHPPELQLDVEAERYIQRTTFGVMRPLWDPRRMRSEIRRLAAVALGRTNLGASWLERRRVTMRTESRR